MSLLRYTFLILTIAAPLCALPQKVSVTNSAGSAVAGAHVLWVEQNASELFVTSAQGIADLEGKSTGSIHVSALGYKTVYHQIESADKAIFITLQPADYDLNEVVITAQHRPTSAGQTMHKINVIDEKEIKERAAINLTDVLRKELNFNVGQDNILGAGVALMGISGENVKIMIDGVPVIGRLDGNIDLNQINMNNVQRIEIIEGPLSVNFGTNAMAGTINIITKTPARNQRQLHAETFLESAGHYNVNASGTVSAKAHSLKLSGGRNYFDGWNPGDDALWHRRSFRADETRVQSWNPREQIFGEARYRIQQKSGTLDFTAALFDETIINRGAPDQAYGERAFDDAYHTARYDLSGRYQSEFSGNWNFNVLAAYNQYVRTKNTFQVDLTGVEQTISTEPSLHDTSQFNTFLSRGSVAGALGKTASLEIGYEVDIEYASGKRIQDPTGQIGNYALFGSAEWSLSPKLSVRPGLRVAYNTRYNHPVVPSLNALYSLTKHSKIRAGYARGFRSPGLKELSFYFVDINHNIIGNPDLDAENGHYFTLGFETSPRQSKLVSYGISAFYNDISNRISLAQVNQLEYTFVNVGETQTTGIKGEIGFQKKDWSVDLGALYTGISNEIAVSEDVAAMHFFPELNGSVMYAWPKYALSFALFYKYNGRRNFLVVDGNDQVQESFIDDWHSADLTVSKNFWGNRIALSIGTKNLFGVEQINIGSVGSGGVHSSGASSQPVGMGRTYFVRLGFNLDNN